MLALQLFWTLSCWAGIVTAVTIYGPNGRITSQAQTASGTLPSPSAVASSADEGVVLAPPPVPSPPPPTQFNVALQSFAQNVANVSIPQNGSFYGFSIEMSVLDQIIGINSTYLNVPFLNLLATLQARSGSVQIRVGGNTQENATVVDSLPGGIAVQKLAGQKVTADQSPTLTLSHELLYMLGNVSALIDTRWYLGIPFNDTSQLRLQIAEAGEAILGDKLLGLQVGNEPDLYSSHFHRPPSYAPQDYANEFGIVVQAIANDPNVPARNNLIGPNIASGPWQPQDVWNTGFITNYASVLGALSVEHYPDNNCAALYPDSGYGTPKDPQVVFSDYLNHTSGILMVERYLDSATLAQQAGKPLLMFETNTASCGGFPGVSDSFGAALWATDYGLQMAYGGFSGALLHVGGQTDTYNPFTPPPTNQTTYRGWSVGPVFYSALAVAETFGKSGKSQIVDIQANGDYIYTPGYAVYEDGALAKVALFNYVSDPTGASDYTATISLEDASMPSEVYVKYLLAPSVSEKQNITWAGQTFGGLLASDGRLQGNEQIQTVPCSGGTCSVKVPAPGFALVFLSQAILAESEPSKTVTFQTTAVTRTINTVSIDSSALATAEGANGSDRKHRGATSKGSSGAPRAAGVLPSVTLLVSLFIGISLGMHLMHY